MAIATFASTRTCAPGGSTVFGPASSPLAQRLIFSAYNSQASWGRVPGEVGPPGEGGGSVVNISPSTAPGPMIVPTFDGSSSQATVNAMPTLPRQITISFWMYKAAFSSAAPQFAFTYNASGVSTHLCSGFGFAPDDTSGNMAVDIGNTSGNYSTSFFARPSAGAWHQYLIAFDRDNVAPLIYFAIDSVIHGAVSGSSTFTQNTDWGANPLTFGNALGFSLYCPCQIMNFHIFRGLVPTDGGNVAFALGDLYRNDYLLLSRQRRFGGNTTATPYVSRWFMVQ